MRHGWWVALPLAGGCMGPWSGPTANTLDTEIIDPLAPEPSAAFVTIGPADLFGWSRSHELGRLQVEEALGISTSVFDQVPPPQVRDVLEDLLQDGAAAVFSTAREFERDAEEAAHGDHGGGGHRDATDDGEVLQYDGASPDLVNYSARMYQALWLAGIVAGHRTESDHVGVVATVPSPESVRHLDAFTLGVRSVRPAAKVEVAWVMAPISPPTEADLTLALIDHGADVILSQTDSPTPVETADGLAWTIAYHNEDGCKFGAGSCLVSAYWNWGPLYTDLVGDVIDGVAPEGSFRWERFLRDPAASAVALSDFGPEVSLDAATAAQAGIDVLEDEPVAWPFVGEIRDELGGVVLAAGEVATDAELRSMCWLVEGVVMWQPGPGLVPAVLPAPCDAPPPPPPDGGGGPP